MEIIKTLGMNKIVIEVGEKYTIFEIWDIEDRPFCQCHEIVENDVATTLAAALLEAAKEETK